jgi:multidrug resistance efflux pump
MALRLVLIISLASAGYWWWMEKNKLTVDPSELVIYGNIDVREVNLTFHSTEHILNMFAWEGDYVEKGQLLASLDKTGFIADVNRVKAEVTAQQQIVAKLIAGSRPQEIKEAQARVNEAQTLLHEAQRARDRIKSLRDKKVASQQQLDDTEAKVASSKASLKVTKETLALVVEGPRVEDIAIAQATLKSYEAQLALVQKQLNDADLLAPANGIIRERILEQGDMASPQQPIYTLALNDPLWVRAYISEPNLGQVALGMTAQVFTDSYPGKTYQGWIGFISPTAEFTPKNVETPELRTRLVYQSRIFVCNPDNELRLGMPVTVVIPLGEAQVDTEKPVSRCTGLETP